ncbi:DNA-binding protein [Variovorax sp. LG9.2]|uniref:DNA-binding protein n=1 Tax=Variovorax sp. LG9.2 TaxID=3048626 RepID=UPI002B23B3B8|nr:DNA-binding protein [Variovorax sp. LG9.2]MEB0059848.1 DNA-binding protein [Variovorax sp. LG9.2]
MSEIRDIRSGRGIQEADVWGAADVLLSKGIRPTIDKVRHQIGRGSPNTVSPMLERWFSSLSQRIVGGAAPPAGNDADGVPVSVRNAMRLLWETARREAEQSQEAALAEARDDLKTKAKELDLKEVELAQRETAFTQTRASLDQALASSQQAREALEHQVTALASEGLKQREAGAREVARLNALLVAAQASTDRLRQEHAAAQAMRDQDLRDAIDRHTAQERRMLEDVDRARQEAKQMGTSFARERQQRIQSEEAAAQTLEAGRQMLRETQQAAQQMERDLRHQFGLQSTQLAQAQSQAEALQQRLDDLHQTLHEEKSAHQLTRGLLGEVVAATKKASETKRPRAKPKTKGGADS